MKKFFIMLLMLTVLLFSCTETISEVKIDNGESLTIEVGESASLTVSMNFETTLVPICQASSRSIRVKFCETSRCWARQSLSQWRIVTMDMMSY